MDPTAKAKTTSASLAEAKPGSIAVSSERVASIIGTADRRRGAPLGGSKGGEGQGELHCRGAWRGFAPRLLGRFGPSGGRGGSWRTAMLRALIDLGTDAGGLGT
ncbi:hypothetical protein GCM10010403_12850 [Glycomyces rutgersensis]|uniref:Uncharacterized protein n=1 Tax=Glycomyces rutgersensis TaxID=58115 RepID=A0ABN3F8Z7_9ACTN